MIGQRGERIFPRISKLLFTVLLLSTTSAASASPTTYQNTIAALNLNRSDYAIAISCSIDNPVSPTNAALSYLGREFLQLPASHAGLNNSEDASIKALPAVPAALFMVLSGFLCISAVKDRKLWLAALGGLFWAGQMGIQVLPQLALRLGSRSHSKQHKAEHRYPYYFKNYNRLRADIEGTQYISLLRHLAAIPCAKNTSVNKKPATLTTFTQWKLHQKGFSCSCKSTFSSLSANVSKTYSLNPQLVCSASKAEQFIRFSPAFIFEMIPRGPPHPA